MERRIKRQAGFVLQMRRLEPQEVGGGAHLRQVVPSQKRAEPSWTQHSALFTKCAKPFRTGPQMVLSKCVLFKKQTNKQKRSWGGQIQFSGLWPQPWSSWSITFPGGSCETSPHENLSGFRWKSCSRPPEGSTGQGEPWLPLGHWGHGYCWWQVSVSLFFPPRGHNFYWLNQNTLFKAIFIFLKGTQH